MTMKEGMKCSIKPADGEPKGHDEAQNRGKGMTPSLASSWLTRDWAKVTVKTLPYAERATRTLENSQQKLVCGSRESLK